MDTGSAITDSNAARSQTQRLQQAVLDSNPCTDWKYVSEGNRHIIFAYTSNTNATLQSLVLNIDKDLDASPEDVFASHYIARKWLGDNYVNQTVYPIAITLPFVHKLVHNVQAQRPIKRRSKHPFDAYDSSISPTHEHANYVNARDPEHTEQQNQFYFASLETDARSIRLRGRKHSTLFDDNSTDFDYDSADSPPKAKRRKTNDFDTADPESFDHSDEEEKYSPNDLMTFDIKPKWMYLNHSPFIADDNIKKHICRFAMHQQFKFGASKPPQRVSKYCPLSLLSGDVNVIAANLTHLLHAKQTNIKIFHQNQALQSYDVVKQHHIDTVAALIRRHQELFQRIAMLQRLDRLDIEVIHAMWMELKRRNKVQAVEQYMHDTQILDEILGELNEEWNSNPFEKQTACACMRGVDAVKAIIARHVKNNESNVAKQEAEIRQFVKDCTDKQLLLNVTKYLLSSIFKDCQVLMTVDFNHTENYNIVVIDLNSKPIGRIENKWLKQDREIIANYIRTFAD